MTATATTTTEASTSTAAKTKAPPVSLGDGNEKTMQAMKGTLKAPGTELGLLARGFETVLRDLQARLDERGDISIVQGVLGQRVPVDIKATALVVVGLQVGPDEPILFAYPLTPGRQGSFGYPLGQTRLQVPAPVEAEPSSPSGVGVTVSAVASIKPVNDMGPEHDPTATSGPGPAGLGSEDLSAFQR